MAEATITTSIQYPDLDAPSPSHAIVAPHPKLARAPFTEVSISEALIADTTTAGEVASADLGDIGTEVTGFVLKNNTGQDMRPSFNGSVEASDAFRTTYAAQMAILAAFTGSDSAVDIVAAIATAKTALDAAAAAVLASSWSMPNGAVLSYAAPVAATDPLTSIAGVSTATQSGDGTLEFTAVGDP